MHPLDFYIAALILCAALSLFLADDLSTLVVCFLFTGGLVTLIFHGLGVLS